MGRVERRNWEKRRWCGGELREAEGGVRGRSCAWRLCQEKRASRGKEAPLGEEREKERDWDVSRCCADAARRSVLAQAEFPA